MQWKLRAYAIGVIGAVNLFFVTLSAISTSFRNISYDEGAIVMEFGVVVAGVSLFAFGIVAVIATYISYESVYRSPNCYLTLLVPVDRSKVLLSRIAANAVFDAVGVWLALLAFVVQSSLLAHSLPPYLGTWFPICCCQTRETLLTALLVVIYSVTAVVFMYFVGAMDKSVFAGRRYGQIMSIVASVGLAFVLLSVDYMYVVPVIMYPSYTPSETWLVAMLIARAVVLFWWAVYLLEKKVNI